MTRRRFAFAPWRLRESPTPNRFRATCLTCLEPSPDVTSGGVAQQWCLEHAGRTWHTAYEVAMVGQFEASLTDASGQ
ncbi:hypothetical protein [Streptomyces sp. NPDC046939]|uniref:DUF7848 domain-containing protein n=1 Tax=Streptomyces sp. NPDC046939 TaxID=3155376 RepID=UPI0033DD8663